MNRELMDRLVNWPRSFITGTDLRIILPGTDDVRKAIIKRAIHEGYISRLKRDLYLIANITNKPLINLFEIAQLIYGPSYISFESALSEHGWIPESVPVICSAVVKRSKSFETPLAIFSFEKISASIFSLGVLQVKEKDAIYCLADPWKAIADIIFCRDKDWKNVEELLGDLRIEPHSILHSNEDILKFLSMEYPHKRVCHVLNNILKSLKKFRENNNDN